MSQPGKSGPKASEAFSGSSSKLLSKVRSAERPEVAGKGMVTHTRPHKESVFRITAQLHLLAPCFKKRGNKKGIFNAMFMKVSSAFQMHPSPAVMSGGAASLVCSLKRPVAGVRKEVKRQKKRGKATSRN